MLIAAFSRHFNYNLVIVSSNIDSNESNKELSIVVIKRANPVKTLYFGYLNPLHYFALIPNGPIADKVKRAIDDAEISEEFESPIIQEQEVPEESLAKRFKTESELNTSLEHNPHNKINFFTQCRKDRNLETGVIINNSFMC